MKNRDELPQFLNSLGLTNRGVEVGSFKGDYAKLILNNWPGKLYMVDIWKELPMTEYDDTSNMTNHPNLYMDCVNTIKGLEDRGFMLRMDSLEASKLFEDNSLDFVYIDANHTYEHVSKDIENWFPKVKSGGILSGHDYLRLDESTLSNYTEETKNIPIWMWPLDDPQNSHYAGMFGVNPAVDEFVQKFGYELNQTEEWCSSWWVVKK